MKVFFVLLIYNLSSKGVSLICIAFQLKFSETNISEYF